MRNRRISWNVGESLENIQNPLSVYNCHFTGTRFSMKSKLQTTIDCFQPIPRYREGRYFKYGEETVDNLQDVRHFTQLVWKGSTSIGIGMATDSDGRIYFVCLYQPPGNVAGQFAANLESPFKVNFSCSLNESSVWIFLRKLTTG